MQNHISKVTFSFLFHRDNFQNFVYFDTIQCKILRQNNSIVLNTPNPYILLAFLVRAPVWWKILKESIFFYYFRFNSLLLLYEEPTQVWQSCEPLLVMGCRPALRVLVVTYASLTHQTLQELLIPSFSSFTPNAGTYH